MSSAKQAPTRRAFCAAACRVVPVLLASAALEGRAAGRLTTIRGQVDVDVVHVSIAGTPLAQVAGTARVVSDAGSFLVTRTGDQTFVVLTAICSHEACTITDADGDVYVCPCHESRFDVQGRVLLGPAELPLAEQRATFLEGVLAIAI